MIVCENKTHITSAPEDIKRTSGVCFVCVSIMLDVAINPVQLSDFPNYFSFGLSSLNSSSTLLPLSCLSLSPDVGSHIFEIIGSQYARKQFGTLRMSEAWLRSKASHCAFRADEGTWSCGMAVKGAK